MGISANAACTIYDMYITRATDEEIAQATGISVEEVSKTIEEFLAEEPTPEEEMEYEEAANEGAWYEDDYEAEAEL